MKSAVLIEALMLFGCITSVMRYCMVLWEFGALSALLTATLYGENMPDYPEEWN